VLAVFEVKKTLYGPDLKDAFIHLRSVHSAFLNWLHSKRDAVVPLDITRALRAFSRMTGVHAPSFKDYDRALPGDLALVYFTLVIEQLTPVPIVLGYGGCKTERGLRAGMVDFLTEQGSGLG